MSDPTRIPTLPTAPPNNRTEAANGANRTKDSTRQANSAVGTAAPSFAELLRTRQGIASDTTGLPAADADAIRFSAHAQTRLQSRHIAMQPDHIARLQSAVGRAAAKGSKDALVLMDDMALIVSVKNRTVVTVVDKDNLKQNVFTNIDSAVIA